MNSQRQNQIVFETYQKARQTFVQTIAEQAARPANVEGLFNAGVMGLLRPLLLDSVPSIQQTAALALGRMADVNVDVARAIVTADVLPQLVYTLAKKDRFYKKAASFVLRTVAKHDPALAKAVVDSGALHALVMSLEEFDPGVKESAAWALGYIARHNLELAQAVVDAGAVPLLILCLQEPEISLKRISASALSDISKHAPELAQTVVDSGAVSYLAQLTDSPDAKLKRQIFSALGQISKHSVELAEMVVEAEIFPAILPNLKDPDEYVQKNVAVLIREICKHSPELSQLIVNSGGIAAVVDFVTESKGNAKMPGIMTLGYIAASSERLAMSVITSHAIAPLAECLRSESEHHVLAATAWSLGRIGCHTSEHARYVAEANVFPGLMKIAFKAGGSEDMMNKATRALEIVLQKCTYLPALEALLPDAPSSILKHVIGQFAKVLPSDAKARKAFVTSKGLKKIQEINADPGSSVAECVKEINACFPEEIVKFFSPGYSDSLLETVDRFEPRGTAVVA